LNARSLHFLAVSILLCLSTAQSTARAQDTATPPLRATWSLRVVADEASKGRNLDFTARLLLGMIQNSGGAVNAGKLTEEVSLTQNGAYLIRNTIKPEGLLATIWRNTDLERVSEGQVAGEQLSTTRYVDQRVKQAPLTVTVDAATRQVQFHKGDELASEEVLNGPMTDAAALPWMFAGRALPLPGVHIAFTDGKSVKSADFDVTHEAIMVAAQSVASLKLVRKRVEPDDASITLWIREEDGVPLRMIVGLNARYGVAIDQERNDLPSRFAWTATVTP
jgi:hypothetical protein